MRNIEFRGYGHEVTNHGVEMPKHGISGRMSILEYRTQSFLVTSKHVQSVPEYNYTTEPHTRPVSSYRTDNGPIYLWTGESSPAMLLCLHFVNETHTSSSRYSRTHAIFRDGNGRFSSSSQVSLSRIFLHCTFPDQIPWIQDPKSIPATTPTHALGTTLILKLGSSRHPANSDPAKPSSFFFLVFKFFLN